MHGLALVFGNLQPPQQCGIAPAAYLTITKLTDNQVVCPLTGCSTILTSPFAQIGPVPLPALGMLGYGSVAAFSWLGTKQAYDLTYRWRPTASRLRQLAITQQAILLGATTSTVQVKCEFGAVS
jgi:uncharacterized membrane protein